MYSPRWKTLSTVFVTISIHNLNNYFLVNKSTNLGRMTSCAILYYITRQFLYNE
jgi:hypothetical protein